MREAVDDLLDRRFRVATREQLLGVVSASGLDDEIRRGHLQRVFPRTYARPWYAEDHLVRERAALLSVGFPSALSHHSALHRYGLLDTPEQVHVTVPVDRCPRRHEGLVIHRCVRPPRQRRVEGLPTATPAAALVGAWPALAGDLRRAAVIDGVRRRLADPAELTRELASATRLPGRRDLLDLIGLLASGCHSELEIWGLLHVFDVPGLRHGVRQRRVRVAGTTYVLDLAYDDEMVAVELDGDAFHSTAAQRDRDRRRDAALATLGWLTLRFSHGRLHRDVAGCRRDTLATLANRRRRSASLRLPGVSSW